MDYYDPSSIRYCIEIIYIFKVLHFNFKWVYYLWNDESDVRWAPPDHVKLSLPFWAWTRTFTWYMLGGNFFVSSFWSLTSKFGMSVLPPANTMLDKSRFLNFSSHLMTDSQTRSCRPAHFFLIKFGWNISSGAVYASSPTTTIFPSGSRKTRI